MEENRDVWVRIVIRCNREDRMPLGVVTCPFYFYAVQVVVRFLGH